MNPFPLPTIKMESRWPKMRRMYMLPWEMGLLLTMLDSIRPKRMLELGVNEGRTAAEILKWIDSIEYYLGVDVPSDYIMPNPAQGQQAEVPQQAAHLVSDKRFELLLRTTGLENTIIADRGPFDAVWIDGDHSYDGVNHDIGLSLRVVKPGGWLFYHDYNNGTVDVTRALNERRETGVNLVNIEGTMIAYEQI